MDSNMILAGILGFGAALALMYIVLRKYTYPAVEEPFFSDPTFFKLFTVGLIAGTGILVGYTFSQPWSSFLVAILFALIFELAKLIVLNLKRFHGKSDSLFYGFGMGIGVGCAFSFGLVFYVASSVEEFIEGTDVMLWMLFAVICVSTSLIHSATGLTIGEGIARRRPFEFLMQALIISVSYQLLVSQIWAGHSETMIYAFIIISLLLAFGYFYHTVYIRLPGVIREVLRMEGKNRKDIPR